MTAQRDPILARYAEAARHVDDRSCACSHDATPFGRAHYDSELDELPGAAVKASLGCGNPVAVVDLRPGETVLDLGSGGGIDVLISARRVGPTGHVFGLDVTPEMVDLARRNAQEAVADNVEFLLGTIEQIPLGDASVDVVVSNCVIVLSRNKPAVFSEIARVLRPGGRLGISDIIRHGDDDGTCIVDCAASAITAHEYETALGHAGLREVSIRPADPIGGGLHNAIIRASKPHVEIRTMQPSDWPAVRAIYESGIATGNATLESSPPDWDDWDGAHLADHRVVATEPNGTVIGWAALSPVSDRCAYGGVAEDSVYVRADHQGEGVGSSLLELLIARAEAAGFWTIQTGILPENVASLALHEQAGFRVVGRRERIGRLNGVWRDVYLLERRSDRA